MPSFHRRAPQTETALSLLLGSVLPMPRHDPSYEHSTATCNGYLLKGTSPSTVYVPGVPAMGTVDFNVISFKTSFYEQYESLKLYRTNNGKAKLN